MPASRRSVLLVVLTVVIAAAGLGPAPVMAGAGATKKFVKRFVKKKLAPVAVRVGAVEASLEAHQGSGDHDSRYATKQTLSDPGTINSGSNPVDWTKLKGMPAGLADGLDGGDVAAYCARLAVPSAYAPCTVAPRVEVDTADSLDYFTSIAIGADGHPVIAYYDVSGDLNVAHCGNPACTSGNTLTPVDTVGGVGWYPSIAIGVDGNPVISYRDFLNSDLKVARCGNPACTSGNTFTSVDTVGSVGSHTSIAIGANGNPVVSYLDASKADLKVARCGNRACTSGNTLTPVDIAGQVGSHTSIAIGTDGNPVVSYRDLANEDLKVAHCGNPACTSGNTLSSVDTAGEVGVFTSIAIGSDGNPVVSYHDLTNRDLKVAWCGNPACTSGNTLTRVDTAGNVGAYTSIAIGTDGNPIVSYQYSTNGDLRVARCGNLGCTSENTLIAVDVVGNAGHSTSVAIGTDGIPIASHVDLTRFVYKVARLPAG